MAVRIRVYQPADLATLKRLTIESFADISLDQNVEMKFGLLAGRDWRWRKERQVDDDVAANPAGVFVVEEDGRVLGYISTRLDRATAKGRIPNLAVDAAARGRGLGRQLLTRALDHLRCEGMEVVMIETMANNAVGQHLYPACGFEEVGRQIHYALKL